MVWEGGEEERGSWLGVVGGGVGLWGRRWGEGVVGGLAGAGGGGSWLWGVGCRVRVVGCRRVLGVAECRVSPGVGCWVSGAGCRVSPHVGCRPVACVCGLRVWGC